MYHWLLLGVEKWKNVSCTILHYHQAVYRSHGCIKNRTGIEEEKQSGGVSTSGREEPHIFLDRHPIFPFSSTSANAYTALAIQDADHRMSRSEMTRQAVLCLSLDLSWLTRERASEPANRRRKESGGETKQRLPISRYSRSTAIPVRSAAFRRVSRPVSTRSSSPVFRDFSIPVPPIMPSARGTRRSTCVLRYHTRVRQCTSVIATIFEMCACGSTWLRLPTFLSSSSHRDFLHVFTMLSSFFGLWLENSQFLGDILSFQNFQFIGDTLSFQSSRFIGDAL